MLAKKKVAKKVTKKVSELASGGDSPKEIIAAVNQLSEKKVRGVVMVATFGKRKGDIKDFKTITNKTTLKEFSALLHTLAEESGVADDLVQSIMIRHLGKILG